MKRSTVEDVLFPACPVRNILARLCDKWALLVLYLLARSQAGMLRFTELKQAMPDISQKMLATTLRTLEEDGYIHADTPCRRSAPGRVCAYGACRNPAPDSRRAARLGHGEHAGRHAGSQEGPRVEKTKINPGTNKKAAQLDHYAKEGLLTVREIAVPKPAEDEVLVKVCAAAVNPLERLLIGGRCPADSELSAAEALATSVRALSSGSGVGFRSFGRVMPSIHGCRWSVSAAFAEYVAVAETAIAKMPAGYAFRRGGGPAGEVLRRCQLSGAGRLLPVPSNTKMNAYLKGNSGYLPDPQASDHAPGAPYVCHTGD